LKPAYLLAGLFALAAGAFAAGLFALLVVFVDVVLVVVVFVVVVLPFVVDVVVLDVVVFVFDAILLVLAAVLFAVSPPQAIPKALKAKSDESAIIFFILKVILLSSSKINLSLFLLETAHYEQPCPNPKFLEHWTI